MTLTFVISVLAWLLWHIIAGAYRAARDIWRQRA